MQAIDPTLFQRSAQEPARHRVAIFNVKFSPNLGDGIIAECLEGALRRADPRLDPVSIDLAGRTEYSPLHGRRRARVLSIMERMPAPLRALLVPAVLMLLVKLRFAPRWRHELAGCDSVVVGGGNLFQDVDQNFPIKIAAALKLAAAQSLPVAVASVGVSGRWSAAGARRIVTQLLRTRLVSVSARDLGSVATWGLVMSPCGVTPAGYAPDPALLSARQYGPRPQAACGGTGAVGLCITAPMALRLHHEGTHNDDVMEAWYYTAARELVQAGRRLVLFTNGSPEDRLFRDRLRLRLEGQPGIGFAPDFACPRELAQSLAGFECVLAHRLHACIVAYAYKVPTVGFAWDAKLRSFFEQTGRGEFVVDPRSTCPMDLPDIAAQAIVRGVDGTTHADLVDRAARAIDGLAARLVSSASMARPAHPPAPPPAHWPDGVPMPAASPIAGPIAAASR
ncbi:polysaccharide pyruvyl transferase family protein [Novosphingobium guangzhouense]|uniref:Polysaccharide pyruvyl transferase n=1 Tax=Novosphingobium guangzhouense TaxID=1850347 RepID=A0A2K2G151_9SPHN|nr:polysaccharide pyruvyl transferase family protein [Novosphingobium guangzhouense]PNU04770.1 polysaccharide pyruvyl transferase [Novosphingobium guangzhouense]